MNNLILFPRYVNSFQVEDIQPIEEVQRNPQSYLLKTTTHSDRLVFTELIRIARIKQDVYVSHETIAKNIKRCRRTVQRAIKKLRDIGLVNYLYRPNKSSLYRPSSFLLLEWVRNLLKDVIPTLSWISIAFLTAGQFAPSSIQTEMSHDIKQNRFIYYQSKYIIDAPEDFRPEISRLETKVERVVNPIVQRLHDSIQFDDHTLTEMAKYSDKVLLRAEKIMAKAKNVKHKPTYFLAICANEQLKGEDFVSDNKFKSKFTSKEPISGSINSGMYKVHKPKVIVLEKVSDEKFEVKKEILDNLNKSSVCKGWTFFGDALKCIENLKKSTRE